MARARAGDSDRADAAAGECGSRQRPQPATAPPKPAPAPSRRPNASRRRNPARSARRCRCRSRCPRATEAGFTPTPARTRHRLDEPSPRRIRRRAMAAPVAPPPPAPPLACRTARCQRRRRPQALRPARRSATRQVTTRRDSSAHAASSRARNPALPPKPKHASASALRSHRSHRLARRLATTTSRSTTVRRRPPTRRKCSEAWLQRIRELVARGQLRRCARQPRRIRASLSGPARCPTTCARWTNDARHAGRAGLAHDRGQAQPLPRPGRAGGHARSRARLPRRRSPIPMPRTTAGPTASAREYRSSDDGEPAGTAGRPILAAIDGQGCDQVVVGGDALVRRHQARRRRPGARLRRCRGRMPAPRPSAGLLVDDAELRLACAFDDSGEVHAALAAFGAEKLDEHFDADGVHFAPASARRSRATP